MIGPGTCTVVASQAGSGIYDPALDVEQSVKVIEDFPLLLFLPAILGAAKQQP